MRRRLPVTQAPEKLPTETLLALSLWLQAEVKAGRLPREFLSKGRAKTMLGQCLDWHRSNGVQRADWPATARNWFRKQAEIDRDKLASRRERYAYEHPQEDRGRGESGLEPVGPLLRLIRQ